MVLIINLFIHNVKLKKGKLYLIDATFALLNQGIKCFENSYKITETTYKNFSYLLW